MGRRRLGDPLLSPHGFEPVSTELHAALLETYWTIPERQIETSVVLANPPLDEA